MKTNHWILLTLAAVLAGAGTPSLRAQAADTNATTQRIGVYDSRILAYADFWSEAHQQKLNATVKDAREAKAAGNTERFKELEAAIKSEQERNHLQVFSTAPVDNVLAGMKDGVAKIQAEAGVSRLVSKWDEQTLKGFKDAGQVDVTDLLLREFKLTDQQKNVVADLRTKRPLPLEEAKKLLQQGKL